MLLEAEWRFGNTPVRQFVFINRRIAAHCPCNIVTILLLAVAVTSKDGRMWSSCKNDNRPISTLEYLLDVSTYITI